MNSINVLIEDEADDITAEIKSDLLKGDKGEPFRYSDFTPEQLANLKGEKGDKGDTGAKGDKGEPFEYSDFSPEQLANLKGDTGAKGDKGDPFTYSDFTQEQLASLKGEKGELVDLVKEEEGKNISIESANLPAIEVRIEGESQQGASPSPDYPSPIENVEGNIEFKDVWENLVNPNNVTEGYINDNSGQLLGINVNNKSTGYIEIDGEEKYYILSNKGTGNWGAWYDKDKKFISGIALEISDNGIITAPSNAYFMRFTLSYNNNNPNYANNVMIARSDKAIPYTPHKEQKVIFSLSDGQKLMEDSYLASDGTHHKRKQIVLDGSDNRAWYMDTQSETSTDYFYTRAGITTENINSVICSHFKKGSRSRQGFWATTFFCITMNKTVTGIISSDTKVQRITKFKTWLATQYANGTPVIVEYELAEEEIVPYTETQKEAREKIKNMILYKGTNNISCTGKVKIKYYTNEEMNEIYAKADIIQRVKNLEDSLDGIETLLGGV